MEIDKISKLKQEPHLSGAYIRSLVKQLTTSRPKTHLHDGFNGQTLARSGDGFSAPPPQMTEQKPQTKKQVRRRLHTSRPYQERLLNMAEARREIVTALKFHRASMKHANEQQQQQQQQQQTQSFNPSKLSSAPSLFEQESKTKSRRQSFNPYSWSDSHMNFTLPNQTLGLNLNFHDFNNIDTSLYNNSNNPSIHSSSTSSSLSPSSSSVVTEEVHQGGGSMASDHLHLHQAMDDEGMAEIRSLGEQHQMEWNDTVNLVTSACWFKFLKNMELEAPEVKPKDDDEYQPFDQVMEFPAWLNANETCLQQHFADEYFQDPALPRMEIGEIEGLDGEWLS